MSVVLSNLDTPLRPRLTVIVPVYNEQELVRCLLTRVLQAPYPDKQIVVVDDGSTDGTQAVLEGLQGSAPLLLLRHATNRGKGSAIRTGLKFAQGVVTLIQDADLEYDPNDYPVLVEPLLKGEAAVVYGSRYLFPAARPWSRYRVAIFGLNVLVRILYERRLTDEATCYKAARTELWRALDLQSDRFEFCAEVTAKVCQLGLPIREVPIHYYPRSIAEGKKIGWADVWPTVWTLLRWRFRKFRTVDGTLTRRMTQSACDPAVIPQD